MKTRKFALASLTLLAGMIQGCASRTLVSQRPADVLRARSSTPANTYINEHANELRFEIRTELARLENPTAAPVIKVPIAPNEPLTAAAALVEPEVKTMPAARPPAPLSIATLRKLDVLEKSGIEISQPSETPLIFDIPVTYNDKVKTWIRYFQTDGRQTFKNWLERSSRFLPVVQTELAKAGLPQDLVYVAMIESGFTPGAVSHAGAKGMWQFIVPTAHRYGLKIDWWIDERKDFHKATQAAIHYMRDLYGQFNSWYLVAASYNMGENGVRRLIQRHNTNNFWELSERGALPQETSDYVPKIIAAMLISKAPALYGFRDLEYQMPLSFEFTPVPGGTDILNLATYLGISEKYLKDLNPELTKGFVPTTERSHLVRVPKGSLLAVAQFIRRQNREANRTASISSTSNSTMGSDSMIDSIHTPHSGQPETN